jgi:hypothetical protein
MPMYIRDTAFSLAACEKSRWFAEIFVQLLAPSAFASLMAFPFV